MTSKHYKIWTKADKQTLARMTKEGYTAKEIAMRLGRTENAVYSRRSTIRGEILPGEIQIIQEPIKEVKIDSRLLHLALILSGISIGLVITLVLM